MRPEDGISVAVMWLYNVRSLPLNLFEIGLALVREVQGSIGMCRGSALVGVEAHVLEVEVECGCLGHGWVVNARTSYDRSPGSHRRARKLAVLGRRRVRCWWSICERRSTT